MPGDARVEEAAAVWHPCPAANPSARVRLFAFPRAGGVSADVRRWVRRLPPAVELCPVELPGHHTRRREPPVDRLEPLLADIVGRLLPFLDKPFAFFGHSLGGLLAFETARALARRGAPTPGWLGVAASPAPSRRGTRTAVGALGDSALVDRLRRLGGTPPEVLRNTELLELVLPVLRADFAVLDGYRYVDPTPLDCPVTAFVAYQDSIVARSSVDAWRRHTTGGFSCRLLPGGHFFEGPANDVLVASISADLIVHMTRKEVP